MHKTLIIKIGGSVLTNKAQTQYSDIQADVVRNIFQSIKAYIDSHDCKIIIVHGAGGHVHALAKRYGLKDGASSRVDGMDGTASTQNAVKELHDSVCRIATSVGLPIRSIHPQEVIIQDRGVINEFRIDEVHKALTENSTPILYGEMVPDTSWNFSVCSGDQIISSLTSLCSVKKVIFLTDVDGVYTSDPHTDTSAILIETISIQEALSEQIQLSESHNTDVTGGLRGKIESCQNLFKNDSLEEIHILNGTNPENVHQVLEGSPFPHTVLKQ